MVPYGERPQFPRPLMRRTRCLDTSSKATLWMKAQHKGALTLVHRPEKPAGSTYSSTSGLSPLKNSRGKWGFIPLHKTRPDSPVPTLQGPCYRSQKWRGTLRYLPQLEMRPSSASVQTRLLQGIRSRDGVVQDQDTIDTIRY